MILLLVSFIISINIPVTLCAGWEEEECGPKANSGHPCWTACTSSPETRACSLYGRDPISEKVLCKWKLLLKNTYKNPCSKDLNFPIATPTTQCGVDTDNPKTDQQKPNPDAVKFKWCIVFGLNIDQLKSILSVGGGGVKYCAQFVDEKGKKRKFVGAAYPHRPYFYQGVGIYVAVCAGESGIERGQGAHQQYFDVQSENKYDTDRSNTYGSNAYGYANGIDSFHSNANDKVVPMVMFTFVLLCFICVCISGIGGIAVGACLFSWYPKVTNNNVDIV